MPLSDDKIEELRKILKKKKGEEVSVEEAREAAESLARFAELMYEFWVKDRRRAEKLKEHPNGYTLDGFGYNCFICGGSTPADGNWYDKWGIKCLVCQRAVNRKEIPPSLAKFKDSWYSKWELESRFNLTAPVLRRWVKEGIMKARVITNEKGKVHAQLFLLKDNREFLPPKKMVESRLVREDKDGQIWHRSYPWYRFVDPFEHLKGYKIMDHMQRTTEEV